ncbi:MULTISPECIES: DUF1810 domain-containing protein [unclassified Variovorax]|uniref:DUF1810 domain-containing protein n=1 Tax=unclassified Variovorax TaxID=663243 RepID=UPI0008D3FF09|nr:MULTISPECIES: DUF1810 domain-containing protein [unclassified Variovorax]SEK09846.1 Uncharacterized protein, DUF1810 family [Variovorax sp. OK202]SFD65221.1 Uncharacterized protein, DUF1810 family [Variovorax sp. OK212]
MPFDLERFLSAQAPVYEAVRAELAAGRKASHWMWFMFPQLRALGRSPTAKFFGIEGLDEAKAYWAHPVLSERLALCTQLVLDVRGRSIHQIFGSPDDMKLHSCMTLFEAAAPEEARFARLIEQGFGGVRDDNTLALLRPQGRQPG